jgi:hypothetical protein
VTLTATFGDRSGTAIDADEALSTRLRDLALVDLDALIQGGGHGLIGAFAEDIVHALGEARARIAVLRNQLSGPDPLNVLDLTMRQRASDTGVAGGARSSQRLVAQADAARAMARLADLSAPLIPKLFEADRRR